MSHVYPALAALVSLVLAVPGQAQAGDVLLMRNGDRISGEVVEITPDHVLVATTHSGLLKVDKAALQQLTINSDLLQRVVAVKETVADGAMNAVRGKGNQQSTHQELQRIGEPPADEADIRKLFLRQSSVLLAPGRAELEVGVQYQRSRSESTVLNSLNRQASLTLGGRVGFAERWQGFFNLPLSYASQQFSFGQEESVTRGNGLGDINVGVNYQMMREGATLPDMVALASFNAPSGRSPYADGGSGVALGAGHWSANLGVQFIKTIDPVAIYGGVGVTQHLARDGLGQRIKPGNAFGYNLGLSFAINDTVSVSGEFVGSAQAATRGDGARMIGTSREPMQFRSGMIYRVAKDWYLAPTISYGLNRDAPDVTLGISSSHRLE